jgi:hypothetical protein
MRRAAVATSQHPLASARILPSGPSASRTASRRAVSSRAPILTLAVEHWEAATSACALCGDTAGTVTFTGTRVRTGAGHPSVAASRAAASQRAACHGM